MKKNEIDSKYICMLDGHRVIISGLMALVGDETPVNKRVTYDQLLRHRTALDAQLKNIFIENSNQGIKEP